MNIPGQIHQQFIAAKSWKIAAYISEVQTDELPVIFLHKLYFYNHLWDTLVEKIKDRTGITVNMSLQGLSKTVDQVNY